MYGKPWLTTISFHSFMLREFDNEIIPIHLSIISAVLLTVSYTKQLFIPEASIHAYTTCMARRD